jgi:uncharacterized protein (DUF2141 family)
MTWLRRFIHLLPLLLCAQALPTGVPVQVEVQGLRSNHGHLMVAVCTRGTFLGDHCPYVARVPAHLGTVTATVTSVPPGTYAVQVWHDENDNEGIDRNFIGIPTEGIGFSRNVRFHFGPPHFDDAAVRIAPNGARLEITLLFFD